ncbi:hypothetical protein ACFL02_09180 [Planctomycetota bacterium]
MLIVPAGWFYGGGACFVEPTGETSAILLHTPNPSQEQALACISRRWRG